MRSDEEVEEMKAAKGHEEPAKVKSYDEGVKDGWIHCLDWWLEG